MPPVEQMFQGGEVRVLCLSFADGNKKAAATGSDIPPPHAAATRPGHGRDMRMGVSTVWNVLAEDNIGVGRGTPSRHLCDGLGG